MQPQLKLRVLALDMSRASLDKEPDHAADLKDNCENTDTQSTVTPAAALPAAPRLTCTLLLAETQTPPPVLLVVVLALGLPMAWVQPQCRAVPLCLACLA
jgi:hypothetical protein